MAQRFLAELLALPEVRRLLSSEHFSVDGTLLQAWASLKSFRRKDGEDEPPGPGRNGERDFRGEKRSNATHASTTDPDARLYRKGNGQPAELCYIGHALMENRNGLIVGGVATRATGDAEPLAAIELVKAVAGARRITLGADKAYDTANFVMECREEKVTPHVAQNITTTRGSRIDGRTTRHPGYAASLRVRKRIEEGFGWVKEVAGLAQVKLRGLARVDCAFVLWPRRLQPGAAAEAPGGGLAVSAPMGCRLIGRWRIVAADLWERGYLDLCGPATLDIRADGHGEIAFGALQAGLDLAYGYSDVSFDWEGFDEMDEVQRLGVGRTPRRRLVGDRVRLPARRRRHPQGRTRDFFSSLLAAADERMRGDPPHRRSG